jgi:DNA recombination protein RmuC
MQNILPIALFLTGALIGGLVTALVLRARITAQSQLVNTFKALAADTLNQNSAAFLQLAEGKLKEREQAAAATLDKKTVAIDEMVKPVKETLQKMDAQLQALEVKREGAYRELAEMVTSSRETQTQLRNETSQLLQALRAPTGRGRWGELQLQRILEMTGMSTHARDFVLQGTVVGDEGAIRPDVIVALPGNRSIVIDSKVPLAAYLDAVQTGDDETRQNSMKQHARQVKDHIKRLGNKAYWEQVEGTPEFVVLFLPGEHFLSAALDGDPDLMEYSTGLQVVLATPMTLIALLRTVAYGWRQEAQQKHVQKIADMGRKLHGALLTFCEHLESLGGKLGGAVASYNSAVGSLERNVLSKARQLGDYGATSAGEELPSLEPIEKQPRAIAAIPEKETSTEAA